jgi:hypothetical protein
MSEQEMVADLERETRSSITFKRSAKLEPYWDIKVYFESGNDNAAEDALARVAHIDAELRGAFLSSKALPY